MLIGRIAKQSGPFWSAECEPIGAFTQGTSVEDAIDMLRSLIELQIDSAGFRAKVTDLGMGDDGARSVFIEANEPARLAAQVLKYQREINRLSLADVAKRLGVSSRSSYATYEQGRSEPSLSKFSELLAAVAPNMALIVGRRACASSDPVPRARGRIATRKRTTRRAQARRRG